MFIKNKEAEEKDQIKKIRLGIDCASFKKDLVGAFFGRGYCKYSPLCRWKEQGYYSEGGECSGIKKVNLK